MKTPKLDETTIDFGGTHLACLVLDLRELQLPRSEWDKKMEQVRQEFPNLTWVYLKMTAVSGITSFRGSDLMKIPVYYAGFEALNDVQVFAMVKTLFSPEVARHGFRANTSELETSVLKVADFAAKAVRGCDCRLEFLSSGHIALIVPSNVQESVAKDLLAESINLSLEVLPPDLHLTEEEKLGYIRRNRSRHKKSFSQRRAIHIGVLSD